MICTLMLLAALVGAPGPGADGPPLPTKKTEEKTPAAKAEVDWEIPLQSAPRRALQAFECAGHRGLLIAAESHLAVRSGEDGARIWIREDLGEAGLQHDGAATGPWGCWLGWAGTGAGGSDHFEVFSLVDGRTVFRVPVNATVLGPPTPSPSPAGEKPYWYLPVEGDRVLVFDSAGKELSQVSLSAPIWPPLFTLGQRILVSTGSERRATVVGESQTRRRRATGIVPFATTSQGDTLFSAGESTLTAWRCRESRHGRLRCRRRWTQTLGGDAQAAPLVVDDTVVVASRDSFLHAFASKNGHLLWRTSTLSRLSHAPIIWDDLVVTPATENAEIFFHRIKDGSRAGSIRGGRLESFPAGAARIGDRLFVPVVTSPRATASLRAYRITRILDPR